MKVKYRLMQVLFTVLLSCAVIITCCPATMMSYADDANNDASFNVQGSKKAEPTLLGADRKTTVTLKLPAGEYQNAVDIVFAMDSSSSSQNSTVFLESVNSLFDSILENNENLKLKVGVVRFRGRAHDAVEYVSDGAYSGLTEYNDDSKIYIDRALNMSENDVKAAFGSGSNTHGGIDIANEWLEADTELDDSHKYLVLLTDGKTYIWNDDNNDPTTIYAQWYRSNTYTMQNSGRPGLSQSMGYNKYAYPVDVLDRTGNSNVFVFKGADAYQQLYDSTSEELTGVSEWDQHCYYADDGSVPSGTVDKHNVTNGAELFGSNSATYGNRGDYRYYFEYTPDEKWKDLRYLEGNPFAVIDNGDGTYTFDTETINPNYYLYHVDCLQKGMYKAGHLWTEVNEKYNTAVITYSGGSNDAALSVLRPSFISWLQTNSDYGADIKTSEQVQDLFKGIDNSIRYMVGDGVVTDEIADEFSLYVPEGGESPFRMTYNGEPLVSASVEDNAWNFGTADEDGKYPYAVQYDPESKTITWMINVPIENSRPVTLSYDLILGEEYPSGTYDTNKSAVLDYTSTDGKYEGQYVFEKPVVEYLETDIEATKVWDDSDDRDGKREDVTFVLLADGEVIGTREIAKDATGDDLTVKWKKLPVYADGEQIEYTVEEEGAADGKIMMNDAEYTVSIEGDAENGFTITNKYTPEPDPGDEEVPDKPDEPEVPDEPDVPEDEDVPDEPEVPDEPDTPDDEEVPDEPDDEEVPDEPDDEEVPDEPDDEYVPDDEPDDEPYDEPDDTDVTEEEDEDSLSPATGDSNELAGMLVVMGTSAAGLAYLLIRRRRDENL